MAKEIYFTAHDGPYPDGYLSTKGYCSCPRIAVLDFEGVWGAKKVIIKSKTINIVYDYPLNKPVTFTHTSPTGFSKHDLMKLIKDDYRRIYYEEDAAVGDPGYIPDMDNREQSFGPYGIWGHYLEDLVLEGAEYDRKTKTLTLSIGS